MDVKNAMAALASGKAAVVDVTNRIQDGKPDRADSTDRVADDFERQVALG